MQRKEDGGSQGTSLAAGPRPVRPPGEGRSAGPVAPPRAGARRPEHRHSGSPPSNAPFAPSPRPSSPHSASTPPTCSTSPGSRGSPSPASPRSCPPSPPSQPPAPASAAPESPRPQQQTRLSTRDRRADTGSSRRRIRLGPSITSRSEHRAPLRPCAEAGAHSCVQRAKSAGRTTSTAKPADVVLCLVARRAVGPNDVHRHSHVSCVGHHVGRPSEAVGGLPVPHGDQAVDQTDEDFAPRHMRL